MKKVGIIGYGRFGQVLADLLSKKYKVLATDCNLDIDEAVEFSSLEEILECFLVFIAVPIRSFEAVVQEISQHKHKILPEYKLIKKEGPSHLPTFTVSLKVLKFKLIKATGESKRQAEKNAAKIALNIIDEKKIN